MDEHLKRLAASVSRARSLEQLARPILELLQRITGLESTYLTTIDQVEGLQQVLFARNSGSVEIPEGISVDWQDTLCRRALAEQRFATDDVPGVWPDSRAAAALGLQSYMSAPVRTEDGELFGTLCAAGGQVVAADEQTRDALLLFSELIARQVDREKRAREADERADLAERRAEDLGFVSALSQRCVTAHELEPVLLETAALLPKRALWVGVLPFLMESAGARHTGEGIPVAAELISNAVATLEAELGQAPCAWLDAESEALRRVRRAAGLREQGQVALVRARSDAGLEGGLLLMAEPGVVEIPERDRDLMTHCANVLSLLAERIGHLRQLRDANRQLAIQAMHDALTGLPNRRYLLEELQRMLARAGRAGESVHVAFVDLDDFKPINDTHGHEIGDEFLQAMADRLTQITRSGDIVARYGGDEFVLVATSGTAGEAAHERRRIRERIQQALQGTVRLSRLAFQYRGPSVGVVTCEDGALDARHVITRADEAMYRDKLLRKTS